MRPGRRPSRRRVPPARSRRGQAGHRAHGAARSPTTTMRSTSARACSTAIRRRSCGGCRGATTSPTRTGSSCTSTRGTTAGPAAQFWVSAAGVQRDAVIFNDSWDDHLVGRRVAVRGVRGRRGLDREMRIPFSQLRFTDGGRTRRGGSTSPATSSARTRATGSSWCPRRESGLASRLIHLDGLDGIQPRRRLELLPYARPAAVQSSRSTAGDPFNDGSRLRAASGLDLQVRSEQQPHAGRHGQPRLRPGRGRPGGREPHRLRDVLPREASVLHRGRADLHQLRAQRRQQLLGLQPLRPDLFYSRRIGRAPARLGRRDVRRTRRPRRRSWARPSSRAAWPARGRWAPWRR